jgi:hypothetical protein
MVCLTTFVSVARPVSGEGGSGRRIEFGRDVLPILSSTCFTCHGPDEKARKSGLRLDSAGQSRMKLKSGDYAIVPGKPDASALVARIFSVDEDEVMPPRKSNLRLTREQKEILKHWIEQGGDYQGHWAYQAVKRPAVPATKTQGWTRNPIDAFVLAKLESEGLKPAGEADRYALARRVALDLTGLPPALPLVDAFVNDQSADAYGKFVDELLKTPAYGERWAAVWLDLARYADSNGYANDNPRTIWRYRDWVINAINKNQPFDQFTIDQLAGDLLAKNENDEQVLATAFHRNTLTNDEGGTNDEEFRVAAVVDRVNTTMQVWMGVTLACAQCHDHKYDPFTQEEYYKLFAILNQTRDADAGDNSPLLTEISPEDEAKKKDLLAQIALLEKALADKTKAAAEAAAKEHKESPAVKRVGAVGTRYVRVENIGKGIYLHIAEVQAFVGKDNVALKGKATQVSTDYDGPANLGNDGNTNGSYFESKSVTHTAAADNPWWEVDLGKEMNVDKIVLWNRTDGGSENRLAHWRIIALDEKRQPVWVKTFSKPAAPSAEATLPATFEKFDAPATDEVVRYVKGETTVPSFPEQKQIAELKKQAAAIRGITTPVMRELAMNQRRKTHILLRGDFLSPDREVQPGTPAVFPPLPSGVAVDRLVLARWLVAPENPLTARVAVNRYWEQLFGLGLVATSEDFGVRGSLPVHPELLDWLASEFVAQGWDVKKLVKLIVTSATYRQASRVTPEQLERDPDNKLLSRGPRFRHSAETVRDQALVAGGILSAKVGGPSVRPPRPRMNLSAAFGGSTDWDASEGDDRHRRGLYTEWRRTIPYPSMVAFDATNRTVCTIRRPRTNTPLQALVTMNDPVYIEAAQGLARRVLKDGGTTLESKATLAFRLALIRPPTGNERSRVIALYQQAHDTYAKDPKNAKTLATVPLGDLPEGVDVIDAAAWTVVGNVVLNLDETLSKR